MFLSGLLPEIGAIVASTITGHVVSEIVEDLDIPDFLK